MPPHALFVAGTVSSDYLVYPMTSAATNASNGGGRQRELNLIVRPGNAGLVAQLLSAAAPEWDFDVVGPPVSHQMQSHPSHKMQVNLIDLRPSPTTVPGKPTFSVVNHKSINGSSQCQVPDLASSSGAAASTAIITGSGDGFEDVEPVLDFLQRSKPQYIIHYMTKPLAAGRLWDVIRNGPQTKDGLTPDNLVVIVEADDLRDSGISLSKALSWELTGEDFVRNLGSNGRLDTLATCPNLLVRFGSEGVIYHQGRDADNPTLYFNPHFLEGCSSADLAAHRTALASAFTAGFTLGFADSSHRISQGIRLGIAASERFAKSGITMSTVDDMPDYPIRQSMEGLTPNKTFSAVQMPSGRISTGDRWSIFNELTGDPAEIARRVVTHGPDRALSHCSVQKFGDMLSVDRFEQESYRAVLDTISEHMSAKRKAPTCIGFRGSSGAGKKYVASNLAKQLGNVQEIRILTYDSRNLTRPDIATICETIRDSTARGTLTVVTFENFDSVMQQRPMILHDFQNLMRDGTFTENGLQRSTGHAVMFFLINIEPALLDSAPTPTRTDFREVKTIDDSTITDCLHGIVQVRGPNCTGPDDSLYPVRRAIMLHQLILGRHPHLSIDGTIDIDDAVLHALLLVPSYRNGLQSLEKIVDTSRLTGKGKFDVASLPPEEQIQLHVDGRIFMSYLRSPKLPPALREKLAHGLFEAYKKQRVKMATTETLKRELEDDPVMCDWEDLPGELKESTRSQADDIPRKLRAVGCFMLNEKRTDPLIHVPEFSTPELDMLSEMEHERFNAERLQRQWRMGRRNPKQRVTPFIVPWRDLTQDWKDVDRVMVECVPRILNSANYYIYRIKGQTQ
ncbi:hypothetical protein K431DRAFT_298621 [Polychaeton citri CBS 116435]|uniref:Ryanodine receptor Ryr domain-containing protein n=1 Tax=Polychaeton citri CBS 116435 TaxID=1314669 RepID=A0A9P4PX25_9PEZI|nr:hypothetical protein K431DRAFT_298621 [Polychaeton citri CBS 116435]